ncbi:hypothetical protein KZP23_04595 [Echinicola marina]|uniref:Uncharacterized protein n=1 Tax=Echinicola rosea TaxID=1807691 RepID=A0ABQ1V4F9_9BACT|nr:MULTISPECIES: hypothetical protein [Echinicola]UCS94312.1 hypothetical protein KZP23_04595 [Echinicola marina]GGF38412.1 hypothetical protein GCM10011339_28790 [Echinicola rosea]
MNSVYKDTKSFGDKKVSTKHAIAILAKNSIQVDEDEATVILSFLYLVAKVRGQTREEIDTEIL